MDSYEVKLGAFIINDLNRDDIVFDNPVFQIIYNEMVKHFKEFDSLPEIQYFTSYSDGDIARTAIELVSSPHELSDNWRKNKIYVNGEEKYLRQTVTATVLSLKAKKITRVLKNTQLKMKNTENPEEQMELLKETQEYKSVLMQINNELGRVVSP